MMGSIFISHSTQDKEVAGKVIEYLESQEFVCWVAPRDISPGMDWAESIIDGIDSASLMILIVSNWSNKSPQVRREVERAVSKGITIIPLITEKIDLSKWMQYYVSAHQWIYASLSNIDNVFPVLKESIQAVFVKENGEAVETDELSGKILINPSLVVHNSASDEKKKTQITTVESDIVEISKGKIHSKKEGFEDYPNVVSNRKQYSSNFSCLCSWRWFYWSYRSDSYFSSGRTYFLGREYCLVFFCLWSYLRLGESMLGFKE